jgi:hypothetical protein
MLWRSSCTRSSRWGAARRSKTPSCITETEQNFEPSSASANSSSGSKKPGSPTMTPRFTSHAHFAEAMCHEPPGAFSSCQPAGQHGPISFFGPLLPRPCLCLGHLHLLVHSSTSTPAPDHDRSLAPDCYAPEPRPDFRPTTPQAPALRHHLERHSMELR